MRLIDADSLIAFMRKGWRVFPSSELQHTCDMTDIDKMPTIEPLTEIDYIELADRYGGEVAFVVKDMIEQTGKRWGNEEPKKMDDVVKVVRCKDCRWWDQIDNGLYGYCHACKHAFYSSSWEISIYRRYKGDWFCADGERKDDV